MHCPLNTSVWDPRAVVIIEEDKTFFQCSLQNCTSESIYLVGKKDCKSSAVEMMGIALSSLWKMSNVLAENMSANQSILRGHYSSWLELQCIFFSVPLPFLYPLPSSIPMRSCCVLTTSAFPPSVCPSEPAFQRREIHKPFIHSFSAFLPLPCLQSEQEAICDWWLTIRFYEGTVLSTTDSHTRGFVRGQCLGSTPLQILGCCSRER